MVTKMAKKPSASSRPAKRRKASAVAIRTNARQSAELTALAKRDDADIDTSDIPEVVDWSKAEIGKFYRPRKQLVTMRLDADVVAWFKARSPKYQTAVNSVLREHVMKAGRGAGARRRKSA